MMLVKWNNVLASKEMGGLGVSSFYALNRALIFKRVWRFCTQGNSIWSKVIKALHGEEGNLDWPTTAKFPSNWLDIIRSFSNLYNKSVDLLGSIKKKVASMGKIPCSGMNFGRAKRNIRGVAEQIQMASLLSLLEGLILPNMIDRWMWLISGDREFSVSSVRNYIDDKILGTVSSKTQWCKFVSIKVNILSWRIKLNNLPTRLNLSRRGLELQTILCLSCNLAVESTYHLFFRCSMMKDLYARIAKWWDVNMPNSPLLKNGASGSTLEVIKSRWLHGLRSSNHLETYESQGRLALWVVKLRTYIILYVPKDTIKGHVVSDFLAEEEQEPGEGRAQEKDIAEYSKAKSRSMEKLTSEPRA
nr:RNA-directed DNA polymerase, eukaryota, reverse transcriptase zinc-binding domain protein [Tanacetum cinerariifolium]